MTTEPAEDGADAAADEPAVAVSTAAGDPDLQHAMLDKVRVLLDTDALPSTYLPVLSDWSLIVYPNMENGLRHPCYQRDVNRLDALCVQYNRGMGTATDPERFIVGYNGSMSIYWANTPAEAAERVRELLARASAQHNLLGLAGASHTGADKPPPVL
jgi:hypothetical protein